MVRPRAALLQPRQRPWALLRPQLRHCALAAPADELPLNVQVPAQALRLLGVGQQAWLPQPLHWLWALSQALQPHSAHAA